MKDEESIKEALKETEILEFPDQLISTSQSTTIHYYVLVKPAYLEILEGEGPETKIREGKLICEKPRLLTPNYIMGMEGFSDEAREAFRLLALNNPDFASLLYRLKYKKKFKKTTTVQSTIDEVYKNIKKDLKEQSGHLSAVIKGVDELWDVSLMKFIQELLIKSAYQSQFPELKKKGLIHVNEDGLPVVARRGGLSIVCRQEIETKFNMVEEGKMTPKVLKRELDRWGVFSEYEDRFLDLFRKE